MRDYPPIRWIVLISLLVPMAAGLLAWRSGFDGLYGQDAFAYFDYGINSLREQLYPPLPFFWPPGYPLAIYATSTVFGENPLGGQLVSLFCGGLVAMGTGFITYEVSRRQSAAILAAVVMAVAGQLWQSSAVVMADTHSLATATLGVWALTRYARLLDEDEHVSVWLGIAAACVSYATITRWGYGAVAVICTLYALWLFYRHRGVALRHGFFAALITLTILLPVMLPSFTAENTYGGNWQQQFKTWSLSHAFNREFTNADGQFSFEKRNSVYYGTLPAQPYYFTPILALFALPGLIVAWRGRMFPVIGWLVIVYLMLVGLPQQNVRFALSYSPPIAVLSGIGIIAVWGWCNRLRILQGGIALVVIGGVIWALYSGTNWTQNFIQRQQRDLATVRWIEDQLPQEAQIIVFGLTLSLDYYTTLETHEIYYLAPSDLPEILDTDKPTYLLLDVYNVETQWVGESPQMNYHALRDDYGLTQLGKRHIFTLYEVNVP